MSGDNESTGTASDGPGRGGPERSDVATAPITIAVNLAGDQVGAGWGRARRVAVAIIANARIVSWEEHDVRWDLSHDQQGEGRHHADIVAFLRGHGIQAVVTGHMGPPMANTLQKLGVLPLVDAHGDARDAALAGAAFAVDYLSGRADG
jgi:predicted Fe-Mo cluster-binding NifX family protein